MFGGRRGLVAVLATGAVVLGAAQASGIETTSSAVPAAVPATSIEVPLSGPGPHGLALSGPTPTSPGTTDLVSGTSGSQAPAGGFSPRISTDGKWAVFTSAADLQPGNPSAKATQSNVFVRNLTTGDTVQLSRAADGNNVPQQPTAGSFLPDISNDGRFVTFITDATNIVPTNGANPVTLVLCDRDPDENEVFDEANPNGSLNDVCVSVYSAAGNQSTPGAILRFDQPSVANSILLGEGRVAWTQLIARPGAPGATADRVYTREFDASGGAITFPDPSAEVKMTLATPASCGSGGSGSTHEESQPILASNGNLVFYVESFPAGGCMGIVSTNALGNPTFSESKRWDAVPTGCGSGFLGDRGTLTGPCAGLTGGDDVFLENPQPDDSGDNVVYRFHDGPVVIGFAGPHAAAPATDTDWAIVSKDNGSSDILSRNNAGGIIDGFDAGISGDGRYAAFATPASGAHDGADLSTGSNWQVVARDLTLDAGATRIAGALATPRDPSRATPANCSPAGADQSCASAGGSTGAISLDATGGRIAYASSATDLLPAPNDSNATNVYVRTWTPSFADQETPGGTTQTGSNKTFDVPVSVGSGFGPLSITSIALAGTDADQFAVSGDGCSARVIHVNESCTVALQFQPSTDGTKHTDIIATTSYSTTTARAARAVATAVAFGPKNAPATTVRTSLDPSGEEEQDTSTDSMISGNGRWDVFATRSDLLNRNTAAAPNHQNIFVRDLADPQNTVQISLHSAFGATAADPTRPVATPGHATGANPDNDSYFPAISSDGRFVSFITAAHDIAPVRQAPGGHSAANDSFETLVVCDRDPDADGVFDELRPGTQVPDYRCFAVESGASQDDGRGLDLSFHPALAGDGSRITWVESDDDLSDSRRVRYADLPRTGGGALASPTNFTYLVSNVPGFEQGSTVSNTPQSGQFFPVINEDGTKIVYFAERFPSAGPGTFAVIEADLAAGTDQRVDALGSDNSDDGVEIEFPPAMSDDGTRVAYGFYDPGSQHFSVYVSTVANGTVTKQLESLDNSGEPADARQPALSGDGRYLAYVATSRQMSNGVDPPLNPADGCFDGPTETDFRAVCQIVARDLVRDAQLASAGQPRLPNELVSTAIPGTKCPNAPAAGRACGGNAPSANPSIDNTGSEVGFDSDANDLVADDTNNSTGGEGVTWIGDSFVHTWRPTITSTPVDFGSVKIGNSKTKNAQESVLLLGATPEAFGPLSLGKSTITGLATPDYKIVTDGCNGFTLHEGPPAGQPLANPAESCTIKVRFKPTVPGTRTAALRVPIGKNSFPRVIRDPAPPNAIVQQFDPAAVRTLTGFGATSVVVVNPSILDFGNRRAKDPLTKTVKVTNTGSTALVISGVVVNDTIHPGARNDYTVTFSNCLPAVAPGASCVISVKFSGSKVGLRDAIMIISSNASAGATTVGLRARVLKPTIESNPAVSAVRRVVTITGKNFAPNRFVDVGFNGIAQDSVKADAHGAFVMTLVVLPNGPQGPRVLFGHSVGLDTSIRGRFDFLVVLGSGDPGGGVVIRD